MSDSVQPVGVDAAWLGDVADAPTECPIVTTKQRFEGRVWSVRTDSVRIGGNIVDRDFVVHTGAVAVIALDASDRVFLLRQYRHPVAMSLFEPPAGLLDVTGEDPLLTAKRELAEEAGLVAQQWDVLVDFLNSPGGSSESIRVYLARDVQRREGGRIQTGEAEELDLPGVWIPLDEAVDLVLRGDLGNPTAVVGVLAVAQAREHGWAALRPADTPWPARDHLLAADRVRTDVVGH